MISILDLALKVAAIVIIGVFLWAYIDQRDNGRYVMSRDGGNTFIVDSRTGTFFAFNYEQKTWSQVRPQAETRKAR